MGLNDDQTGISWDVTYLSKMAAGKSRSKWSFLAGKIWYQLIFDCCITGGYLKNPGLNELNDEKITAGFGVPFLELL
jgi:hypothetical protein